MIGFMEHQALLANAAKKSGNTELTRLREENARLREALEQIIAWRKKDRPSSTPDEWYEPEFQTAFELVRGSP